MLLELCDPAAGVHFREAGNAERQMADGVAIQMDDVLLREWTNAKGFDYKGWRKANLDRSPLLQSMASRPDCLALVDKLFSMIGYPKLSPEAAMSERLYAVKT